MLAVLFAHGRVIQELGREGVLPFGQLQIELHIWNQRFADFLEWWELLEVAGLRPFHQEVRRFSISQPLPIS